MLCNSHHRTARIPIPDHHLFDARRTMKNAALYYHPDGYRTDGKKLMGRQAAGESFLRGYLAYANTDTVYALSPAKHHLQDFDRFCTEHDRRETPLRKVGIIDQNDPAVGDVGSIFLPGPNLEEYAWKRRRMAPTNYSLTGVTHTTASEGAMAHIAKMLTAPIEPWDALICTSTFVRKTVDRLQDNYSAYLAERLGCAPIKAKLQMPVIPLGIFADDYDRPAAERARHRARLRKQFSIGENDIAVLFVGRLSFHAKANPLPMLIALEELAKSMPAGHRVHLIQAGWFANDAIGKAFDEAQAALSPSVVHHLANGRDSDIRVNIWHAADIFCSLADNIQETFGLTPVEAMAASLPVVVSDWDGYRDTIVHNETGIRVPTILPQMQGGIPLAERYEDEHINYDQYCAESCMSTTVDIRHTVEAFWALANNPGLRKQMGAAGRRRARAIYDWRVVVPQYQALWAELGERRLAAQKTAPTQQVPRVHAANPLRANPLDIFADYPTLQLTDATRIFVSEIDPTVLRKASQSILVNLSGNKFVGASKLGQTMFSVVKEAGDDGITVAELTAKFPQAEHIRMPSTLGWLMKIGALRVADTDIAITSATTGPATPAE